MKTLFLTGTLLMFATAASAATIVNTDDKAHMLVITEGGQQAEVGIGPGESIGACNSGCFIKMPNGDRETLSGGETVEISGGKAKIK